MGGRNFLPAAAFFSLLNPIKENVGGGSFSRLFLELWLPRLSHADSPYSAQEGARWLHPDWKASIAQEVAAPGMAANIPRLERNRETARCPPARDAKAAVAAGVMFKT